MTIQQIATNLNLWNEYFNVDGAMSDSQFYELTVGDRIALLKIAFCYQ